jgi:hypothetical protein
VSLSATTQSDIFVQASAVRGSLTQLYTVLAKYRKHEARMEVFNQLKLQLDEAMNVEKAIDM